MITDKDFDTKVEAQTEDDEYETQLLGFTPSSFSNGIYNAFNQYMSDGLTAMKTVIEKEHKDVMTETEINQGFIETQKTIESDFDALFDHFECYLMNNVFRIPKSVVLPEDICQQEKLAPEDEDIDKQIKDLQDTITMSIYCNTRLADELEEADQTQVELDKLLQQLEDTDFLADSNVTDIKEDLAVALDENERIAKIINGIYETNNH